MTADEYVTPICGDPHCGGCPTPMDMELRARDQWTEDHRQANLALGLPEGFGL